MLKYRLEILTPVQNTHEHLYGEQLHLDIDYIQKMASDIKPSSKYEKQNWLTKWIKNIHISYVAYYVHIIDIF